jgi:hypothetical protein
LFGEDPNASNDPLGDLYYLGIAPQGQANVYEFWHFLINNIFPQVPPDVDVVTTSFGSPFDDWWTRGFESLADKYGLLIVAGIGNGFDAHDLTLYPAAGSNVIGVGVIDSVEIENSAINLKYFSLPWPEHSSFGPTGDNRCKPDIVAPGNCLAADETAPDSYEPTGNWSSFSTPVVAGAAGLLVQKAKQTPALNDAVSPQGGNCVMKAILLNSATKLPYWHKGLLQKDDDHIAPLDYAQGAGLLNAVGAYKQLLAGEARPGNANAIGWDNNTLDRSKNVRNIYAITITEPAGKIITATAVWNRHYSSVYPFEALLEKNEDLRLELWAVDLNNPQNDYLLDYSDSFNDNVEHIHIPADANYINYQIVISYSDSSDPNKTSGSERYGLAWNVTAKPDKNDIRWYDLNSDGIVNTQDFDILLDNMMAGIESPQSYCIGDITDDGSIDFQDVQIFLTRLNTKADWYKK